MEASVVVCLPLWPPRPCPPENSRKRRRKHTTLSARCTRGAMGGARGAVSSLKVIMSYVFGKKIDHFQCSKIFSAFLAPDVTITD